MLAKEQRIAALILFAIALIAWLFVAIWKGRHSQDDTKTNKSKPYRTWEQRKDSMRHVDSVRYAQWAAEREQRYDSFRMEDSRRRQEWVAERQLRYDSLRRADSLWRDSVGWPQTRRIKKDTILDLNHCDTTELQFIRGIGRYTALQIVRYGQQLGGYYSPSQLTDEALADLHLDTLLRYFTANPKDVHTMHVNSCGVETLQRHPYLRYQQAKAIYTLRRTRVRIQSIEELRAVEEMSEEEIRKIEPYLDFD